MAGLVRVCREKSVHQVSWPSSQDDLTSFCGPVLLLMQRHRQGTQPPLRVKTMRLPAQNHPLQNQSSQAVPLLCTQFIASLTTSRLMSGTPVCRLDRWRGPKAGGPLAGRAAAGAAVAGGPASALLPASPQQTCTTTPAAVRTHPALFKTTHDIPSSCGLRCYWANTSQRIRRLRPTVSTLPHIHTSRTQHVQVTETS